TRVRTPRSEGRFHMVCRLSKTPPPPAACWQGIGLIRCTPSRPRAVAGSLTDDKPCGTVPLNAESLPSCPRGGTKIGPLAPDGQREGRKKMRHRFTAGLLTLTVSAGLVGFGAPTAHASSKGRKNTAIGLGALAVYGLLSGKTGTGLLAGSGASYAYKRYQDSHKRCRPSYRHYRGRLPP